MAEFLQRLLGTNDCGSWDVRHPPYSPHPPHCQAGECTEHPSTSIVWADGLRPVVVAKDFADPLPPDIHFLWVCSHHGSVIAATVAAAGYGSSVVIGGLPADVVPWDAEPVPAATLKHWLTASRRGLSEVPR
jgi:hypothetical protein